MGHHNVDDNFILQPARISNSILGEKIHFFAQFDPRNIVLERTEVRGLPAVFDGVLSREMEIERT
jgi:hypothetical protein